MARMFKTAGVLHLPVPVYNANKELLAGCQSGDAERVRTALARGANATLRDSTGKVALHYAAGSRSLEIVQLIAAQPYVELRAEDLTGLRPAHMACMRVPHHSRETADDIGVLKLLGERGADLGCKAKNGDTPLLYAARYGLRNAAGYLMTLPTVFRDSLSHVGSQELTADKLAKVWGFDDVAELIVQRGSLQTRKSVSVPLSGCCAACTAPRVFRCAGDVSRVSFTL